MRRLRNQNFNNFKHLRQWKKEQLAREKLNREFQIFPFEAVKVGETYTIFSKYNWLVETLIWARHPRTRLMLTARWEADEERKAKFNE